MPSIAPLPAPDYAFAPILVVDDEPANVELACDLLMLAGYTAVTGTSDPRTVAHRVIADRPDLILLDLLMPDLDGYAVMAQIREVVGDDEYLPILVLTADITRDAKERALAGGATDFLTKPFDQVELLLRVRNLLRTRRLYLGLAAQQRRLEQLRTQDQDALQQREVADAALTHDLGQPLTAIRMGTRLLRRLLTDDGPLNQALALQRLTLVEQANRSLEAMTGELVDLARLQRGRPLDLVYGITDLVTLVAAEVELHAPTDTRHSLTFVPDESSLTAEVDAARLARVVMNLLTNAIKYSPDGGVITVRLATDRLGERPWAVLTVQDEGVGIPAADLPRLFEPFFRASNVTGRIAGTGLGLAGARHIVDAHGGSLHVDSTEGKGTTVTLRLPLD